MQRCWKNLSVYASIVEHECEIAILNAQTVILNSFFCWLNEWAFRAPSHCGTKSGEAGLHGHKHTYVTVMYWYVRGFTYVLLHEGARFNKYSPLSFSSFQIQNCTHVTVNLDSKYFEFSVGFTHFVYWEAHLRENLKKNQFSYFDTMIIPKKSILKFLIDISNSIWFIAVQV